MAVFERESRRKPGTRSNTKLIVSGGMSPAEHWITDPQLPVSFHYDYGGPGQKEVVIAKGMVVGIKPDPELHYETNVKRGVLTLAGQNGATNAIGIAPYNYTKHNDDFLDGNQPAIITRDYIELPYIPKAEDAAEVKWGAVYGEGLKNGDFVTYSREAANAGKIVKYDEAAGHKPHEIIGQVLSMDLNQEPFGWLKWAMWDEAARRQDEGADKTSYEAPETGGFPYDADYAEGVLNKDGYLSPYTTDPTGIPGIHDGSQRAQTVQSKSDTIAEGYNAEKYTIDLGLKNVVDGTVSVHVDGAPLAADKFTVDLKNGKVTILQATSGQKVDISFRAHFFGTPAGWDYKGSVGAVRILLKF